jgi:hypothetical protein
MDVIWMLESHFQGVVENRSCLAPTVRRPTSFRADVPWR